FVCPTPAPADSFTLSLHDALPISKPEGGYFISVDVIDGTATRVWELAKEAGIVLTKAGSAFPGNDDPNNRNIRLAPSQPWSAQRSEEHTSELQSRFAIVCRPLLAK